jgi:putative transport protein
MARIFGLDKGSAAGLLSGALTQSSVIGTATDAINNLPLPENVRQILASNVPVGDAVTYIFGVIAPAILLSKFAPRLFHRNLKAECAKAEDALRGGITGPSTSGVFDAYVAVDLEAFVVERPELAGQTIGAVEQRLPDRCYIQRVRQGRKVFEPPPDLVLNHGDVLVISGNREELLKVEAMIGSHVVDPEAMDMPFDTVPVIVTQKFAIGKTIGELREAVPSRAKGIHLRKITRQGQKLPRLMNTRVERGDILELVGRPEDLKRAAAILGFAETPTEKSDIIFIGITCVVGVILGLFAIKAGFISVSLGTSGGILLAGLIFGWYHSVQPRFGRIPGSSVWLMETLGLNVFITAVGLAAGPHALEAMESRGLQLLGAGVVVTLIPHLGTLLVGHFVFKMNTGILMGASAGAGTATPAIQAVNDEAESAVPTLGFTIPYALSNVLLTASGPVIVALVP